MENLVLTCSMGETSMYMVLWCLKNLKDKYNMVVVCANTGQEHDKSLDFGIKCMKEYNIPIYFIEASVYHNARKSSGYKIVRAENLTRMNDYLNSDNTPFEEVIKKYGLPNHSRLHCTRELKMNPIKAFAKDYFELSDFEYWLKNTYEFGSSWLNTFESNNWLDWKLTTVYKKFKETYKQSYKLALGIRADEFDRMNPNYKELGIIYPLIHKEMSPMTKKQINFFWEQQPFRLELKGYQGNCVACYKKSNNKLMQLAKENPDYFGFFHEMERKYGNVNGKIPQKVLVDEYDKGLDETRKVWVLEKLPKEEYKNTIFREFRTAKDILQMARDFTGVVIDDHIETESCEIFSACGE